MTRQTPDPQPAIRVVELGAEHLSAAARVHVRAFPGFFLSGLGEGVLREFYRAHMLSPSAVSCVALDESNSVVGVIAGTASPGSFYREMVRRNPLRVALAVTLAFLRRPAVLPRILSGLRHGAPVPWPVDGSALLSSVCVDPECRRGGAGALLVDAWIKRVQSDHGVHRAYLTTDAKDNDAVMRWYESNSWSRLGTFVREDGRAMAGYGRTF